MDHEQGTTDFGRYQCGMNRSYHKKLAPSPHAKSYKRNGKCGSGKKSGKVQEETTATKCNWPQAVLGVACSPEPRCTSSIYDCSEKVLTTDDSGDEGNMSLSESAEISVQATSSYAKSYGRNTECESENNSVLITDDSGDEGIMNCSDTQEGQATSSYAKSNQSKKECGSEPQDSRSHERDMEDFSPPSDSKSYGWHDECLSQGNDIGIVDKQSCVNECRSEEIKPLEKNPFSEPWEESDLVLLVANEKFHVHRLVLILNSQVFKAMLKSDFTQARSKEITLPEKDPVEVLDLLLQLYPQQGEDITMKNVEHILKLADEYQMNSVIERCGSFLRITKKGDADAMYILVLAQKYTLSAVAEECCELLADLSLEDLETHNEFEELDGYNLRQVLLPRMRRLEKAITDLQPEISGLLKCATWLWSEAKKPMQWCPVHYAGGIATGSLKDRLRQCEACKNVISYLATNTIRGRHHNSYMDEHPTENFVPALKELFSLTGSKTN